MLLSRKIYDTLCETRRQAKSAYGRESGLHEHHIVPKHMGGNDVVENLTYLTIREHRIAHYLLWRIYGLVNDLRSFHMLGGNLTPEMRKIVGTWCWENKVGMFNERYDEHRKDWRNAGIQKQIENKVGIFNPNNTQYHASLGGKASMKVNTSFQYWFSEEGIIKRASLGGKSHKGKKAMHIPGEETFVRVLDDDIVEHLNNGYVFGSPISPNKGKTMVSKRKKKVSDGFVVYDSLHDAAKTLGLTPSAILYRIRSSRSPWRYACENESSPSFPDEHNLPK